jgi:hypothetical protein
LNELPPDERELSCIDGVAENPSRRLLAWERRNLQIQYALVRAFDITEIIGSGLLEYAENHFGQSVMINHHIYLRIAVPSGKVQAFHPHRDDFGVPSLTLWIPFHDINAESGGVCFEKTKDFPDWDGQMLEYHRQSDLTFVQPFIKFGSCFAFGSHLLHAGTSAKSQYRFSLDVRLAPADAASSHNNTLEWSYGVNSRKTYIPLNYSDIEEFRAEQLLHLRRAQQCLDDRIAQEQA